ncbi:Hcp family type VI secretion system effector [Serratia fonticola]|jgi:type VI secretion system Hcp family effector|uniref:Hcp family type VI secretion system effector n=1 Tax=Serratia fonticola TaxID=47917 RepID=UPI00157692B9|nr:Hcp family type VI secretion system effector [Serratia fonticola]MDK2376443.1 Hcp family type VI secretion system effector [Serratia fonticola]NTY89757.1 Hcp family type VI secretion system effector [Serratia fonticola]NTZ15553.1 Hcp family type VI secretion system effector [Serratia fonticola]CAI0690690.1 Secreted protein hcp [Serratia fonticola]CAI1051740.1 Secreted protein hcp [Serratia fonticola]
MANLVYMTLKGEKQGLISAGCSSFDSIGNKFQSGHADQCMVYALTHGINREQHASHQPFIITKPIDKATPLIGMAISNNEELYLLLDFYRTSSQGQQEKYFSVEIRKANLKRVGMNYPHLLTNADSQPEEVLSVSYNDIKWTHHIAGTTGYSVWDDRVY